VKENMGVKLKYTSKDKIKQKEKKFEFEYSDESNNFVKILKLLVKLLTSSVFLRFVVEIVKLIMNGSFYYFLNNSFFFCGGIYGYKHSSQ
jgi:hypothetical protein